MTFAHNLVATIKVGGKILREYDNSVLIPFGAEYSVFLKNMNSVRALVKVSIDGTDATGDTWLIVNPNSDLELDRFIRNGNFDRGNRFKFIERTAGIEQHRGIKAEDGLVRIEYKFEVPPISISYTPPVYTPWNGSGGILGGNQQFFNSSFNMSETACSSSAEAPALKSSILRSCNMVSPTSTVTAQASSAPGITVPGSESDQKFVHGAWFPTESQSHVIVLQLKGAVVGRQVTTAVTVHGLWPRLNRVLKTREAVEVFIGELKHLSENSFRGAEGSPPGL
jgi:hypothetical protein